jgi:two-component sensor histidine kinase
VRKDGTLVPVAVTGMPIVGAQGGAEGWALVYRDITEARKHEQHMSVVMRELSHRAKNLLAVIGSMTRSSVSSATSLASFEEGFTARIAGLAQSHDLLVKKHWTGVSIQQLVAAQMGAFFKYGDTQLRVSGDDVVVTPSAGQMLGIALHELATYAGKHGALRAATGLVHIRWHVEAGAEDRFVLEWEETGGPPVIEPLSRGFGRDVLEYIVAENLDGSSVLSFAQAGVTWRVEVPLRSVIGG